jgi:hypothetical protein
VAFRETDEPCADCGNDAFAVIDSLVSDKGAAPLCFACYVERIDRVCACGVVSVAGGEFVVGASSVEETRELAQRVADELSSAVKATVETIAPLEEARDELGEYHVRELARGARSETRHVYAGTSERGTVSDVETRTDAETRDALRDALASYVLDEARRVRKRDDVSEALASLLPTLVEHRVLRRLGVVSEVWRLAKERGVSHGSETSARNQRAGLQFEEYFADWCEDRNLEYVRGKTGLVRYHPETADEITRKTDGLAGVPDFLVRGDGQNTFGSEWRPEGDVFVEVKRGDSRLSREQEEVVAHLKARGFEVYVLRGETDEHIFEKR